jgi:hypothetical protein
MPHEVFISYAREDWQTADAVVRALEREGIRCWYAPRNITSGDDYAAAIVAAIGSSRVVVVLLSAYSNKSEYVQREIQFACSEDTGVPVLPVRVENVKLRDSLRLYLGSTHWLDATAPPFDSHLPRLVEQLRARLGIPATVESPTEPDAGAGAPPPEATTPAPVASATRVAEEVERQAAQTNVEQVAHAGANPYPLTTAHPGGNVSPITWPPTYYTPPPPPEPDMGPFPAPVLTIILSILFVVAVLGPKISALRNPLPWSTVALLVISTPILLAVQVVLYPLHIWLSGRPRRLVLGGALALALAGFIYGWSAYLKSSDERASTSSVNSAETVAGSSISGRVRAGGIPAPGLKVELAGGGAPATVTTDADGRFVFKNVTRGVYLIRAAPPPGYRGYATTVDVGEDIAVVIRDIRLEADNVK